jgi:PIN domain nuclease of toxin-antitoxin system
VSAASTVIVLDTHAWIWWISSPERLSKKARSAIDASNELVVPAICCWEVAMLAAKRRLELDRDVLVWLRQALAQPRIELEPLSPEIAVRSASLDLAHGDLADRMILATALHRRAPLISKDDRLRASREADVVW